MGDGVPGVGAVSADAWPADRPRALGSLGELGGAGAREASGLSGRALYLGGWGEPWRRAGLGEELRLWKCGGASRCLLRWFWRSGEKANLEIVWK